MVRTLTFTTLIVVYIIHIFMHVQYLVIQAQTQTLTLRGKSSLLIEKLRFEIALGHLSDK